MGMLVAMSFIGIPSQVDAHVLSWIGSMWNAQLQKAVTILIGLSILAYAVVYIYYACKHRDKPASR
jgi:hypothetical protein